MSRKLFLLDLVDIHLQYDGRNVPVVLQTLKKRLMAKEMYKVNGEPRVILVFEGDPEDVHDLLSSHPGSICCLPVRPLGNFAHDVLKLDAYPVQYNQLTPLTKEQAQYKEVFFLDIEMEMRVLVLIEGETLEEYLEKWKELVLSLTKRNAGELICSAYKVVGQHKVKAFIVFPSADDLDKFLYTQPILRLMGRNFHQTASSVCLI